MSKRGLKYQIYTGIIHKVLFLTNHKYISYVITKLIVVYNGLLGNYCFYQIPQGPTIKLLMEAEGLN
jgi:hypothetical protein